MIFPLFRTNLRQKEFPIVTYHFFLAKLVVFFTFTFLYIDCFLSFNDSKIGDHIEIIYDIEVEIKDIKYTIKYASYVA